MFEKLFLSRIPVWLVGILTLVLLAVALLFGIIVRGVATGSDRYGTLGEIAYVIASFPSEVKRELVALRRGDISGMSSPHSDRFGDQSGWTFHPAAAASGLDGYLLFSRYDGDAEHHVLELVDLAAESTRHRLDINADGIFANVPETRRGYDTKNTRFRVIHPLVLDNGDILVKSMRSSLVRMTPCGDPVWTLYKDQFHHSIEQAPDGTFWSSTWIGEPRIEGLSRDFQDPGLVQFTADGDILFDASLSEMMLKQGLGYMIFGDGELKTDPLHLNDVQPVPADGSFWKLGDIFVSLRHISTIMLIRPSTGEILWHQSGPWSAQHDVDIVDDTSIAVFNNNMLNLGGGMFVDGHSDVVFYDFATDTFSTPYAELFESHDVRTEAEGLQTLIPGGHLYVEEEESGRALIFAPDGILAAEFINRAGNGLIYHLGWSRYMTREAGDRFLAQLTSANCD